MVIFRIIKNLLRLLIATALLPLILFTRRYASIIIILFLGFSLYQCTQSNSPPQQAPSRNPDGSPKPLSPINAVRKQEDGNSRFATDLIKKMQDHEKNAYSQHFYWAMNKADPGQTHQWKEHNIEGDITVTEAFTNKSGTICKRFSENLKVHEIRQQIDGIACAKTGGSWCKLRKDATPACGLGKRPSFWGDISIF